MCSLLATVRAILSGTAILFSLTEFSANGTFNNLHVPYNKLEHFDPTESQEILGIIKQTWSRLSGFSIISDLQVAKPPKWKFADQFGNAAFFGQAGCFSQLHARIDELFLSLRVAGQQPPFVNKR
jgi:hypothetical protein